MKPIEEESIELSIALFAIECQMVWYPDWRLPWAVIFSNEGWRCGKLANLWDGWLPWNSIRTHPVIEWKVLRLCLVRILTVRIFPFVVECKKFFLERPELIFDALELEWGTEDFTVTNDNDWLLYRGVVALVLIISFFKLLYEILIDLMETESASCLQNTGRNSW